MDTIGLHLGEAWRAHAPPEWRDDWRPRTIELRSGSNEIVDMGAGPPLILLPPIPGFKEAFVACAWRLAHSFRVVTLDLRARFDGPPAWGPLVDDVVRVADSLGLERFTLVGHSFGGALAQHVTLAHPDRVISMVLSSAFARVTTPRGQWRRRYLEQPAVLAAQRWLPRTAALALARRLAASGAWVYDGGCDAAVLKLVVESIRRCPLRVGIGRVRLAFAHDTRNRLHAIRCPALLVVGERDTAFALAASAELAGLLGIDRAKVSPGSGHLHPLSNPRWFAETVGEWVARRGAGGA